MTKTAPPKNPKSGQKLLILLGFDVLRQMDCHEAGPLFFTGGDSYCPSVVPRIGLMFGWLGDEMEWTLKPSLGAAAARL